MSMENIGCGMAAPSDLARPLTGMYNSPKNLCSHVIFIVFYKFWIEILVVMVSINFFWKLKHFDIHTYIYIYIYFVAVLNKKVANFLLVAVHNKGQGGPSVFVGKNNVSVTYTWYKSLPVVHEVSVHLVGRCNLYYASNLSNKVFFQEESDGGLASASVFLKLHQIRNLWNNSFYQENFANY